MDKNLLKKIFKIILYIIVGLPGALGTTIVTFHTSIILLNALFGRNVDYQVLLFLLFAIVIILVFWGLFFIKIKTVVKIPIFILLLSLQFSFITLTAKLPTINKILDINVCIEMGHCWDYAHNRCEKHDRGYCIGNSKDCKKNNGIWQEDKQYCQLEEK